MAQRPEEALVRVFPDVLERMAFMFADPADPAEVLGAGNEAVGATMRFTGIWNGTLMLAAPRSLCEELAANVLGLDPGNEGAAQKAPDALKELLNVTCGNVLTRLAGDEPVFDLTVPTVRDIDSAEWDALAGAEGSVAFLADGSPVLIRMEMEAPA